MRAPPEAVIISSGVALLERELGGARDRLADAAAHAAADEGEVHRGEDDRLPADRRACRRAPPSRLPVLRCASAMRSGYGLESTKPSASSGSISPLSSIEAARVEQLLEPLAHREPEVVVALRADPEVALEPLVVDERVAGGALRHSTCRTSASEVRRRQATTASAWSRRCSAREEARTASTSGRSGPDGRARRTPG